MKITSSENFCRQNSNKMKFKNKKFFDKLKGYNM